MRPDLLLALPRFARSALSGLLDRHAAHVERAITLETPGARLRIDRLAWHRLHVDLSGQLEGGRLDLAFGDRQAQSAQTGRIALKLARPGAEALRLTLHGTASCSRRLPPPGALGELRARLAALPRALTEVWRARREAIRFLRTGDAAIAIALRRRFGIVDDGDRAAAVPPGLFDAPPPADPPPATLILPVFNAADDTLRLLAHLPGTLAPDMSVVIIDDGSDDPRIGPATAAFARDWPAARLIRHESNRGFVAAVNTGLAAVPPGHHVILLNTDTLPPPGWVPRLLAPIAADAGVASVTPMSNAAEILSVPQPGIEADPTPELVAAIDRVACRLAPRNIGLPTGVGFCMALNRRFLDRLGGFDPAFGKGYGEEVDWCRRAIAAGGRHVASTGLFVGHRGGASFGASRARRIRAAARVIEARHPGYTGETRLWAEADPAAPERLALALAWLAARADGPVPAFLGHMLGGGAETALRREVEAALAGGAPGAVILRAGGPCDWRVELQGARFRLAGDVDDEELVHDLLAPLAARRVVYSCAVGAADPGGVPGMLLRLADGHRLELRLHDFFPVSPSWNLLDSRGRFRGVPPRDSRDPAHRIGGLSHAEWRARWAAVMARADEITVFAPSGAALVAEAYPEAAGRIALRPHALPPLPGKVAPAGQSIGVLGGINLAKGGAVLERLVRVTRRRVVVIGEMDGRFRLRPPHVVHGRYRPEQIAQLAAGYGVGVWLIPSVCPETFSFATHEALATGLPVAGFDLGAQGETLRAASSGHALAIAPEDAPALAAALEAIWPV